MSILISAQRHMSFELTLIHISVFEDILHILHSIVSVTFIIVQCIIYNFYPTGGKLCFFSPCIEQVQRTCIKLICEGFIELHTYECLQREMNVQYKLLPILDLECLKHKVGILYHY